MKKKTGCCLSVCLAVVLVAFSCMYFIRTATVILGSNQHYYNEVFDYPGSEWVCEEPKINLTVYDLNVCPQPELGWTEVPDIAVMKVEADEEETAYVMMGERGSIIITAPIIFEDNIVADRVEVFHACARYRRSFFSREIISFTIYDMEQDDIFHHRYEKLVFRRK